MTQTIIKGLTINGGSVTVNSKSGIAYQRPQLTGQTTSYRTGDDGWHLANGTYDYTPPTNPVYMAELSDFTTLKNNNVFGNTNRFTDELGGQTYTNDYVIDHYTGLGWSRIERGASQDWNTNIDEAYNLTANTFTDWRMPNLDEVNIIINKDTSLSAPLDYSPFNINATGISQTHTSTTNPRFTTQVINYVINDNVITLRYAKTSTSSNVGYIAVRNHFN